MAYLKIAAMAVIIHLVLVITVITVNIASATSIDGGDLTSTASNQREFDYFMFSLQWPATYCQRTHHCCKSNDCCPRSNTPTQFTIHGLWPNYNDGRWPSCCSKSKFDPKEVSTLREAMKKHWPSLSCSSPSTCDGHKGSFWAHEWGEHGTCSSPVIRDEYEYFLTVINLYLKYNITEVLSEAGYVPSNSKKYPLGGIVSAIENAFHLSPSVVCSNGAVEELRLCFYKDFKPRDCVTNSIMKDVVNSTLVFSRSSCPKYVSLPAYTSSGSEKGVPFKRMHPGSEFM